MSSDQMPAPGKTKLIKFPPSRAGKDVKCPGYARGGGGGMLKLRFDLYIRTTEFTKLQIVPSFILKIHMNKKIISLILLIIILHEKHD